jgi:hypothetical protein
MTHWLRQSTAVDIPVGPFIDNTDGKTVLTTLTIVQADVRLSKNGGAYAQKNSATSASHLENGDYKIPLSTTDTNTLGLLRLSINMSAAYPVPATFLVLPAIVYDALVAGTGALSVDTLSLSGAASTLVTAIKTRTDYLPSATAGAAGGLFIAGTNAATSITTGLTANITGNLSGSVGSVTGAVGSVTGNVGGNVVGTVNSVVTGVAVASIGNAAITSATIATNAINANGLATDAVDEIKAAIWANTARTLTAATNITSTGAAVVLHSDNKALLAGTTHTSAVIPTVSALAAGAYTAIATQLLGSAIPGAYGAGTLGYIVGNNLDGTISSVNSAIGALVIPSLAGIRTQVDDSITFYRLNELLKAELGSAPVAGSLLDHLTEDDSGIRRFTANALEMGPSGEGASPSTIAAEVWNSVLANFQVVGSTGEGLYNASIAGGGGGTDPWLTALPGSYTGTQAGKMLSDILARANALPEPGAIRTEMETASGKLDLAYVAATSGTLFSNVSAVKAKTDNLPAAPAAVGNIPTAVQIRTEIDASSTALANVYQQTIDITDALNADAALMVNLFAVKAKTDNLPLSPAATGDIPSLAAMATAVLGSPVPAAFEIGTLGHIIGTRLDTPLTTGDIETLLTGMKLDQLATTAATSPAAGSFLGHLLETSLGSFRFKAAALSQAPAGELSVDASEIAAALWNTALTLHNNLGTFGWKINSLSSLTVSQLQDAVWLSGPDSHGQQPGTFGWMLDARISGLLPNSAGTGTVPFVYAVTNGISGQPIPEVVVTVSTDAQGQSVIARARTMADGTATFHLNPGTYYFWRSKSGWAFINPDVETVTEAG